MWNLARRTLSLAALALLLSSTSFAQDVLPNDASVQSQVFEPAYSGPFLWAETARPTNDGFVFRGLLHASGTLLRALPDDGSDPIDLVGPVFQMNALGSYAFLDRFRVGLDVPVVLYSASDTRGGKAGLGDLRLGARATLIGNQRTKGGVGLLANMMFPTSTLKPTLARGSVGGDFGVVGDYTVGPVDLTANAGMLFTKAVDLGEATVGNTVFTRLGGGVSIARKHYVAAEVSVRAVVQGKVDSWRDVPSEGLVSYAYTLPKGWRLQVGAGTGFTEAPGTPAWRVVFMVQRQPSTHPDPDTDGLLGDADRCPFESETVNGVRDDDGCPEDEEVLAMESSETAMALRVESQGVPAEGAESAEGTTGEPKPVSAAAALREALKDTDGDGIPNHLDACETIPEDFDGFQDGDGCPEPDNDGDRRLDEADECPNSAETLNAYQDHDGCPDTLPEQLVGLGGVIRSIQFEPSSARLRPGAEDILGKVATVMKADPALRLRVDGHTDNRGEPEVNKKLSQDRADAIEAWLVARGVTEDRIYTYGHGDEQPIRPNATAEGRAANRRVELSYELRGQE